MKSMKTIKLSKLKETYELSCNEAVQKFENKHGYAFDGWIGQIGEMAEFIGQYYFSMNDIYFDLINKVPKGLIFRWQDDSIENQNKSINFRSYAKGLRFEDVEPLKK